VRAQDVSSRCSLAAVHEQPPRASRATRRRRSLALLVAVLLLPATGLAPARAADRHLRVSGPSSVRVGHEVRFPVTGFKPRERITVNLAPTINRGGNCCGIDVITRARADAEGRAILHWRWPSYYFNGRERKAWVNGSRVDVLVLTPSFARGRKVVRVYR
jgi:hypothetical protein